MSEEVYTVEQFAERLKLHPKTVLRFIREGRVRAVKVGKSWRILRSDMEAMMGAAGYPPPYAAAARATTIVELPEVDAERAQRLSRQLPSARMGRESPSESMNLDVIYDPARRHLKVVMVGGLEDTTAMLKMLQVLAGG